MSEETRPPSQAGNEFFVGYLATPPSARRFLRRLLPPVALAVLIVGGLLAAAQRDPGPGVWAAGTTRTLDGIIRVEPYPMVRAVSSSQGGAVRTFLLVSEGKFGAGERVRPWQGKGVRLIGTILNRDGRSLFELADGEAAIRPLDLDDDVRGRLQSSAELRTASVTLRGEIIDPKCYVGAMKPGGGKTHKACAQLCLSGGIPPMFVTRDPRGRETYYLLVDPEGMPAQQVVLPYVGDPVELTGTLERLDDLMVLRVDPSRIVRL